MSANKIYNVEVSVFDSSGRPDGQDSVTQTRLVRASSAAKAKKFVADQQITVEPLTPEDALALGGSIKVEDAPE